jgi:hypothetical protein
MCSRGFGIAFRLSIKSFWFYVFAEKQLPKDLARIRDRDFAKYIKTMRGTYEITGKSDVKLYASSHHPSILCPRLLTIFLSRRST